MAVNNKDLDLNAKVGLENRLSSSNINIQGMMDILYMAGNKASTSLKKIPA
jgi:hypothetical protein